MEATFAIQPTGPLPGALIYGFLGLVFGVVLLAFILDPGAARWGLWLGTVIIFAVAAFIGLFVFHDRSQAIAFKEEHLVLRAPLYGRSIPVSSIQVDGIRLIDLSGGSQPEVMPILRSNGVGLPHLQLGWFSLNNGEKAWCYITDRSSVLYIPTNEGFSVLVSPASPDAVRAALTP